MPACPTRQGKGRQQARRNGRALTYMGLQPGKPINDITIDKVFIGSCTNSRIEDNARSRCRRQNLGRKVARNVKLAMVVPGSGPGRREQAEREGSTGILSPQALNGANPAVQHVPGHERRPPGTR